MPTLTQTLRAVNQLHRLLCPAPPSPHLDEERQKYHKSLYAFLQGSWPYIEPATFVGGWHIEALCEHLEAVLSGHIKKLLIHIPPRISKTTTVGVVFPAWVWTQRPITKFMFASHTQKLSWAASRLCKQLVTSEWYQVRWGHKVILSPDQATKGHFINMQGGERIATSVSSGATGFGADILVLDDPNQAFESQAVRNGTNEWVKRTWSSRANPKSLGASIVVQQRTHEHDVSGALIESEGGSDWVKLVLPMEYESARKCKTISLPSCAPKIWTDPRKKDGELLCPQYIDESLLKSLRASLGSYVYACQYQQRPAPEEGGLIRKDWWQIWKATSAPALDYILQSWDTAFTEGDASRSQDSAAYSACTTWGIFKVNEVSQLILLSVWRGKVGFPELLKRAARLSRNYADTGEAEKTGWNRPDYILIEGHASGKSLAQEFTAKGIPVHTFQPGKYGDKLARVHRVTPYIENGLVWVAGHAPEYKKARPSHQDFIEQCALFPNAESRDLVDTMTQAILYLTLERKMLKHTMDFGFNSQHFKDEFSPGNKIDTSGAARTRYKIKE